MTAFSASAPERLARLRDSYGGRTLLLVSCGPSAKRWREVRATLPDDTVIGCVKQAIFLCGSDASLHFFNSFNCQRYFPHNRRALKVFVDDDQAPVNFNRTDLVFSLDPSTCTGLGESVAATGRFEDYTVAKSGLLKPWGPGIVYEIVAYLALHLGFRSLHTVGWDVAREAERVDNEATPLEHFYDSERSARRAGDVDFEWLVANPAAYKMKALARHLLGSPYNRMPKVDKTGEIPVIVRSLPRFFEWAQAGGMSVTVHTALDNGILDPVVRSHVVDLAGGGQALTAGSPAPPASG